jgi:hypothetical protein
LPANAFAGNDAERLTAPSGKALDAQSARICKRQHSLHRAGGPKTRHPSAEITGIYRTAHNGPPVARCASCGGFEVRRSAEREGESAKFHGPLFPLVVCLLSACFRSARRLFVLRCTHALHTVSHNDYKGSCFFPL